MSWEVCVDQSNLLYFVNKSNADSFFEQLEKLDRFIKQEYWVEQRNLMSFMNGWSPGV